MKRRDFFKNAAGLTGVAMIAPILFTSLKSHAEGGTRGKDATPSMVDANDPVAKSLQYVEVSKEKDKSCANCQLYKKTGMNNGKEVGTCTIFPKKLVYAEAHCKSWAKKA